MGGSSNQWGSERGEAEKGREKEDARTTSWGAESGYDYFQENGQKTQRTGSHDNGGVSMVISNSRTEEKGNRRYAIILGKVPGNRSHPRKYLRKGQRGEGPVGLRERGGSNPTHLGGCHK